MKKVRKSLTVSLFSRSSFFSDSATVLNLGGSFYQYNTTGSEIEADAWALRRDFESVGWDIKAAYQIETKKSYDKRDCLLEK